MSEKKRFTTKIIPINGIQVKKQCRKDMGNLQTMADSIESVGLLHPIIVLADNTLVAGERRLRAAKLLGWTVIRASIAHDLEEAGRMLEAQRDENTCRKDLNPSEAVEQGAFFEKVARKEAKERQKEGQQKGGGDKRSEEAQLKRSRADCPKPKQPESARTTAVAGAAVGMKRRMYEYAKAVVKSGNKEVIEKMDATGNISAAYKSITPPATDQATEAKEWKTKTISRIKMDTIMGHVEKLSTYANKPTIEVSLLHIKKEIKQLRDVVSRILH